MKAAAASCREFLRSETADVHLATDTRLSEACDIADQADYARFLEVMGSTLLRFGTDLDSANRSAGIVARSATLLRKIEHDIDSCGVQHQGFGAVAGNVDCDAFSVGVGYALEGSALGAEVLRRRVLSNARPGVSTLYFNALLDKRRPRWQRYCHWLNTVDRTHEERTEALRGATDVFRYIDHCLDRTQ